MENIIPWRLYLLGDPRCNALDGLGTEEWTPGNSIKLSKGDYYFNEGEKIYRDRWWIWNARVYDQSIIDEHNNIKEIQKNPVLKDQQILNFVKDKQKILEEQTYSTKYCYSDKSKEVMLAGKSLIEQPEYYAGDGQRYKLEGFGILRGRRLFIFLFGLVMFIWLFTALKISESKIVNYMIATIIAASISHSGISYSYFIWVMEALFGYMLYRSMSGGQEFANKRWIAAVVAIALTEFVFRTAFPERRFPIPWLSGLSLGGIVVWALIIIIFIVVVVAGVGAGAASGGALKDLWIRSSNLAKRVGFKIPIMRWILAKLRTKEKWPTKGEKMELHPIFKRTAVELQVLRNYILRLEIFFSKRAAVRQIRNVVSNMSDALKGSFSLNRAMVVRSYYKLGGTLEIDYNKKEEDIKEGKTNAEIVPLSIEYVDEFTGKRKTFANAPPDPTGFMQTYRYILHLFKTFAEVSKNEKKTIRELDADHINTEGGDMYKDELLDDLNLLTERMIGFKTEDDYTKTDEIKKGVGGSYFSEMKRYSTFSVYRGYRFWLLDQLKMAGVYNHTYKFAKHDAIVFNVEYTIDNSGPAKNYSIKIIPQGKNKPDLAPVIDKEISKNEFENAKKKSKREVIEYQGRYFKCKTAGQLVEVDYDGCFIDDKNTIISWLYFGLNENEVRKKVPKIRCVLQREVSDLDSFDVLGSEVTGIQSIAEYQAKEWNMFIDDLRWGIYHPFSRTANSYKNANLRGDEIYRGIKRKGYPKEGNPAFDREALKDPGQNRFWGRPKWNSEDLNDSLKPPFNPFPAISTVGIGSYLMDLYKNKIFEDDLRDDFWGKLIKDSSASEEQSKAGRPVFIK